MQTRLFFLVIGFLLGVVACDAPLELYPGPCTSEHGRWDEEWETWEYGYEYDGQDRLLLQELTGGYGSDSGQWIEFSYDDDGHLVHEDSYFSEQLRDRVEHVYDDAGRRIETSLYTGILSPSKLEEVTSFEYDDEGRLVHEEFQWAYVSDQPTALTETDYEYDEQDRLAVRRVYGDSTESDGDYEDDDGMDNVYYYEYDAAGLLVDVLVDRDNDDTTDYSWQHLYDDYGHLEEVVIVRLSDDEVYQRDTYDYDRVGNLRGHEKFDRYGEQDSFEKYGYGCWR